MKRISIETLFSIYMIKPFNDMSEVLGSLPSFVDCDTFPLRWVHEIQVEQLSLQLFEQFVHHED